MRIKEGYVLRNIVDENVIIPIGSALEVNRSLFTLNETGAFIWRKIEEGSEVKEIISKVADEYDVTLEEAERDTIEYISYLNEKGLIDV